MFPGPTLLSAIGAILEGALNRALALDPAGRRALLDALGGPVQVSITAPLTLAWTLARLGEQVQVSSQPADQPALIITGRPMALVALALGDDRVFADERLTVTGDTALAHQLQRALSQLQPDWEAAMARHIGDVPAHFLGRRLRQAVSWSRQAASTMNANVEEYLHEESRTLPGRRELEATFQDIDQLNLRTERLEARLNQLAAPDSTNDTETL
ncbi:SCP2 sterol-binding domain-containing protein [Marinobacter daepoensis]|uniref:Ubiquinone biosynthesis accessory factor UbiJ n=1 Tax=Marinobacter daepoensis TaxID=262077 RepID=A0ABS3BFY4_9GAMM|nr:SCP2 sterol-binding domain-containing protein [Marinobacter daepoensis]MBN7770407.1 SCP2 sterol-binding domain-containing protein [Marinobacter daepoensis]MBY6033939.1 SCP2 sterol-binding domain-containing protein [Marinobacter daepoensis]MBY6079853.1 SCP2 sterol-binding domain-containing protein [Marinobacter daepoensis]